MRPIRVGRCRSRRRGSAAAHPAPHHRQPPQYRRYHPSRCDVAGQAGYACGPASDLDLVVVGVDGAGRTHRANEIAAARAAASCTSAAPLDTPGELAAQLAAARAQGLLVLVDDAHRLAGDQLAALAAAARQGVSMVVARRPSLYRAELADLDEAVAGRGRLESLAPLDVAAIGTLVARVTGRRTAPESAAAVWKASAGLPAVAAALAAATDSPPGVPPPALVARVQRQLATADPGTRRPGPRTGAAARPDRPRPHRRGARRSRRPVAGRALATAMRSLRDRGLLVPGGDAMVPAVAQAVRRIRTPAERRRVHDSLAAALMAAGANPMTVATHLRAARTWTPTAG